MAGVLLRGWRQVGALIGGPALAATPDQELLARFLTQRDESAFAMLMERHGAMVFGVCQGVLGNVHDAEDALQAVFLVLASKARSVRKVESLASWLHGVARRVAGKLQTSLARRRKREGIVAAQKPTASEPADLSWNEVLRIVDAELRRLPETYRAPLILCHLEGRTQDEAACELGWTLGALRGRLERGRALLRARLTQRGVTGAAALTVAALVPNLGSAALPTDLVAATAQASVPVSTGQAIPAVVPEHVAALTREALRHTSWSAFAAVAGAALIAIVIGLAWFTLGMRSTPEVKEAPPATWTAARKFKVPNAHAWTVAFSPDGKRIAAGFGGVIPTPGQLKVWNAATGNLQYAIPTPRSVRCVAFSPDGALLACAEHDGAIRLRDAADGTVRFTLRGHRSMSDGVAFSADGTTLATSSWDGSVKLWDTRTGHEIQSLTVSKGQSFSVAMGRKDGLIATACANGSALLWQPSTGGTLEIARAHDSTVHWVALAPPDGKILATASWDKTIKLWDTATGKPLATLRGHRHRVLAVAFSPDGKHLASGGGDWGPGTLTAVPIAAEVILWDVRTRKFLARLPHDDRVFGVAFAPDGNTLATACWDGSVTLWQRDRPVKDAVQQSHFVTAPNQEEPKDAAGAELEPKSYAEDYHPTLKTDKAEVAGLTVYGADLSTQGSPCVKFTADGLRVTLPADYPRQRPGTGVITDFGLRGDFEITARFEILHEPKLGVTGNPTNLMLVVVPYERPEPEKWWKANQNRASLAREYAGNLSQFRADATTWNNTDIPRDQWGNEQFDKIESVTSRYLPTRATTGRLRLVRRGAMLYFFVSENMDKEFTQLFKSEFGAKDVKNVRVLGSTGWPGASLDVLVTDLHIRADGFLKTLDAGPQPELVSAGRAGWALVAALAGLSAAVVLSIFSGLYMYWRRRPAPVKARSDAAPAEAALLACPGCGKRLKVRTEQLGRRLKCSQCGTLVQAPKTPPEDAQEAP